MAEILEGGWIREEDIYSRLGIGPDILELCMEWEIICAPDQGTDGTLCIS